jgi:uncharacterized tellurite resistance protein B-like protein
MNKFYRRSINEYQRQIGLKESFAIKTERLRDVLETADLKQFNGLPADRLEMRRHIRILLLAPLIEIAWADGRVTRRESETILQVAASYDLVKDDAGCCQLLEQLTSRPIPPVVGRMWQDFYRLFENLTEFERQTVADCLSVQTQFIAEQSSDNLLAFLRGERVSKGEHNALQAVERQLENALTAAKSVEENRNAVLAAEKKADQMSEITIAADNYYGKAELRETLDDYSKLIPLIPLVKTAWAEGRVTKRERHLIFEAAARMGIKPETAAHRRLAEWLELHPTEEFYDSALGILHQRWQRLDAEEKNRRRFDLLSDCTRIAEASGGAKNFPSGGVKICEEEVAAVKHIARKLNPTAPLPVAH